MRRRLFVLGTLAAGSGAAVGAGLGGIFLGGKSRSPVAPQESVQPLPSPVSTPTTVAVSGGSLYIPQRRDVRLMVVSDLNSAYGSTEYEPEVDRAIELIPYWKPDIVIGGGDMVAGQDPRLSPEQIRAMWAAFDQHFAAPLRRANLPYGFTIGNHDASSARAINKAFLFQKERDLATEYWQDPAHDPGLLIVDRAGFPFYYTFEHQGVFYLVWDGSSNFIPPEQMAWAEQSLASEKAQMAKLRIVIGHLPLYSVAVGRNEAGEVLTDAEGKRALLERYRVHTYISGHHHSYYPAHKGQLQLLHSGILGAGARPLIDSPLPTRKTLTVIDIDFAAADTIYTTYNMKTLELIDQGELPRFIAGVNGVVLRRDIEWEELTAEELSTCQRKIGSLCRP